MVAMSEGDNVEGASQKTQRGASHDVVTVSTEHLLTGGHDDWG